MIRLHEAKMLQTLHRSLTQNIPEAIKVYGAIFHINRGNPFNLEVLVDSWPDYQTVITRPQKQEMMDDKDRYTNTYHIFSKNLQKLPEILESDSVINWKQSLTIQGCQKGLDEKIRDAVASKSVQVNYNKRFLYITDNVFKSITSNASKLMKPLKVASSENVYGSIFNIIRGNPFNLEVLVDSWPNYQTVITWPQKQEMMDDKDYYINSYHIEKLPEILGYNNVINWKQSLTIQGSQNGLNEKIRDAVASKAIQVDYSKRFLYLPNNAMKSNTSKASKPEGSTVENVKFRSTNDNFKLCLLDISHAELVNNNWKFGQNERSLRFIQRCLQNFPGFCLVDPEGKPITWILMEQTNEWRMGYTLPEYQNRGIAKQMMSAFMQYMQKNDIPFFAHVEEMNEYAHKVGKAIGFHFADCGWHEWKCVPTELL
ncbi:glycine N-acyltransferase-like protein 2 [Sarcophilus harrisii]